MKIGGIVIVVGRFGRREKMFKFLFSLFRFFRRVIFERGWYVVPSEEEDGYIVPEIWKDERKYHETTATMIRDEELRSLFVPKWLIGKSREEKKC